MKLTRPHCKKSFSIFPSPAGMSLTKLSLGGNNDVIYKFFPPRETLVSDTGWGRKYRKAFFTVQFREQYIWVYAYIFSKKRGHKYCKHIDEPLQTSSLLDQKNAWCQ
jgi:hypothetical protein